MLNSSSRFATQADTAFDLELIAQRIVKLAEIATLDHLEALLSSQAKDMYLLAQEAEEAARGA